MARTVQSAFNEFNDNIVNLSSDETLKARNSRDFLLTNLHGFDTKITNFPLTYSNKSIKFGSFARKTKIIEVDDIDLMLCFNGSNACYSEYYNGEFKIHTENADSRLKLLSDNNVLNSRKVIEKIKSSLSSLYYYEKAEIHRQQEAVTLKLSSYTWNFDIVPCFFTTGDFYLIPDGNGNWKKADPRLDQERVSNENQRQNGRLLQLIRTLKYWNSERKITYKMGSYFFENLVIQFSRDYGLSSEIDLDIRKFFLFLYQNIENNFDDPKGFQGNINNLSYSERLDVKNKAFNMYQICCNAYSHKENYECEKSIKEWQKVFGSEFPNYG